MSNEMPHDATLSPQQVIALAALLRGASVTDAAAGAKVDRATLHRWLRDDCQFRAEYGRARADLLDAARSGLRALATEAVRAMRESLAPSAPPAIRLRAALSILEMVGADKPEPAGPLTPADAEREIQRRDQADLLGDLHLFGSGDFPLSLKTPAPVEARAGDGPAIVPEGCHRVAARGELAQASARVPPPAPPGVGIARGAGSSRIGLIGATTSMGRITRPRRPRGRPDSRRR